MLPSPTETRRRYTSHRTEQSRGAQERRGETLFLKGIHAGESNQHLQVDACRAVAPGWLNLEATTGSETEAAQGKVAHWRAEIRHNQHTSLHRHVSASVGSASAGWGVHV
jgi:hypothetical protein